MDKGNIPDADGDFSYCLYFNWNDGKLEFNYNWVDNANQNFGSTSALG